MAGKPKFEPAAMAEAIIEARGLAALAAQKLQCDSDTVRRYIKKYKVCRQALKTAKENNLDLAEGKLFSNIAAGSNAAIFYYLNNHGAERGYSKNPGGDVMMEATVNVTAAELTDDQLAAIARGG